MKKKWESPNCELRRISDATDIYASTTGGADCIAYEWKSEDITTKKNQDASVEVVQKDGSTTVRTTTVKKGGTTVPCPHVQKNGNGYKCYTYSAT